jgi:hypothetical protein
VNPNSSRELRTRIGHHAVRRLMKRVYGIGDRRLLRFAEYLFFKKQRTLIASTKEELTRYYADDIDQLEKRTGMSFEVWRR